MERKVKNIARGRGSGDATGKHPAKAAILGRIKLVHSCSKWGQLFLTELEEKEVMKRELCVFIDVNKILH